MQDTTTPAEAAEKLSKLIHGIQIAMMTTTDTDGTLRSRPMATQTKEFDGDLWFFSGKSSHKTAEIDADHRVNLSYADPSSSKYVSVSGTCRLVQDKAKAEQMWNPMYKAWFPKGLEDPDLCLLKVTCRPRPSIGTRPAARSSTPSASSKRSPPASGPTPASTRS